MRIYSEEIEAYLHTHSKAPMEEASYSLLKNHPQQHLICGQLVGGFLGMLTKTIQPLRVLEIGTMIGYSTICIAKNLPKGARVHTIERRPEDAQRAKGNFDYFGVSHLIEQHVGMASEVIPLIHETWNLVFIDADKTAYKTYYELVLPFVSKGGHILLDNMLFHGKVVEKSKAKNARALSDLNDFLVQDERVENILLPIRDGLQWLIKK